MKSLLDTFFVLLILLVHFASCYEFYDANWTIVDTVGDVPITRHSHSAVLTKDGKMVIFAGCHTYEIDYLNDVAIYEIGNKKWKIQNPSGTLPISRRRHTAVISNNNIMVVFGGLKNNGEHLNDVNMYSIDQNAWLPVKITGTIPLARQAHTAIYTSRNTMLIFGGRGATQFFNDLWELDLNSNAWKKLQPKGTLPEVRAFGSSVTIENHWYIFGGLKAHGGYNFYFNSVLQYDIDSNTWLTNVDEPYAPSPRAQFPTVVIDGAMIAVGGYDILYLHDVVLLDFKVSPPGWQRVIEAGEYPDLGIDGHTAVVLGNDIYIYGGEYNLNNNPYLYKIFVVKSP